MKKINAALVSVFHKEKLEPILAELKKLQVEIYSTGGTQRFIEEQGVEVTAVEDLTSYPSILGGRVKTLHPKVFGGILARRENESDRVELQEYNIPEIDLVIVDLYPFEETVANSDDENQIIEKIDIGGISLIRAAAKNFKDSLVVSSRSQYGELLELIQDNQGFTSIDDRKRFAAEAFNVSSHYDTAIFNWFANGDAEAFKQSITNSKVLRYGENPHQQARFFGDLTAMFDQLHGKELSFNNLVDVDAAVNLIAEFDETTFVVIKHTNACGVASRSTLLEAWKDALAGDPVSAFGGILICNRELDAATAEEMNKLFFEVIIAPAYSDEALEILKSKKNRIILVQKQSVDSKKLYKSILNGAVVQDADLEAESTDGMTTVTERQPTGDELNDLVFANKTSKHLKSNTIVLARGGQLLGMGCGQTSRVDALKQAIEKARNFGFELEGCAMASDAFFPFNDCVEIGGQAGVKAVVQPGGSIRDKDSIEKCNELDMAMVTTGTRHFKH